MTFIAETLPGGRRCLKPSIASSGAPPASRLPQPLPQPKPLEEVANKTAGIDRLEGTAAPVIRPAENIPGVEDSMQPHIADVRQTVMGAGPSNCYPMQGHLKAASNCCQRDTNGMSAIPRFTSGLLGSLAAIFKAHQGQAEQQSVHQHQENPAASLSKQANSSNAESRQGELLGTG